MEDLQDLITKIQSINETNITLSSSIQILEDINLEIDKIVKKRIIESLDLDINRACSSERQLVLNVTYKNKPLLNFDFSR